jgi:predicted transcriptional regulator
MWTTVAVMAQSLLPARETTVEDEPEPECVPFDRAGGMIEALSSPTARRLVGHLRDEPLPASELADRTSTSLQNVTYHLENLLSVDVVEVVDTWYSSRGKEMNVYGLAADPVVICIGDPSGAVGQD